MYAKLASAVGHKWHILVHYGFQKNAYGEKTMFKNEGIYYRLSDAKNALTAFIEIWNL